MLQNKTGRRDKKTGTYEIRLTLIIIEVGLWQFTYILFLFLYVLKILYKFFFKRRWHSYIFRQKKKKMRSVTSRIGKFFRQIYNVEKWTPMRSKGKVKAEGESIVPGVSKFSDQKVHNNRKSGRRASICELSDLTKGIWVPWIPVPKSCAHL